MADSLTMETVVENIPIARIIPPRVLLRPVRKDEVDYLQMRDSIRENGLANSIAVRPYEGSEADFEVVDGNYRFHCCIDLRWKSIPSIVGEWTDEAALSLQLQANVLRPETTKSEIARQLMRLQKAYPGITINRMARLAGRGTKWVSDRLTLQYLSTDLQRMVDRDQIPLESACLLAKIPPSLRDDYVVPARELKVNEFKAIALPFIQDVQEQLKRGKLELYRKPFQAQPYLRSLNAVLREQDSLEAAAEELMQEDAKTALDGWKLCLRWVTKMNPKSVNAQRIKSERLLKKQILNRDLIPDHKREESNE